MAFHSDQKLQVDDMNGVSHHEPHVWCITMVMSDIQRKCFSNTTFHAIDILGCACPQDSVPPPVSLGGRISKSGFEVLGAAQERDEMYWACGPWFCESFLEGLGGPDSSMCSRGRLRSVECQTRGGRGPQLQCSVGSVGKEV